MLTNINFISYSITESDEHFLFQFVRATQNSFERVENEEEMI